MSEKKLAPVHPGEVLEEEFLKPLGLSQHRLARYFNTSAGFWLGLQAQFDLDMEENQFGERLEKEVKLRRLLSAELHS